MSSFYKRIGRFLITVFIKGKQLWYKVGPRVIGSRFYGKWFFKACAADEAKSIPNIANIIKNRLHPQYVIDYGCGDGYLLSSLAELGVKGLGYEYSDYGIKLAKEKRIKVLKWDFTDEKVFPKKQHVDIAICLEVAEHLPAAVGDHFCKILTESNDAPLLIFSAARPGQAGEGHLNMQPANYWKKKLASLGWRRNINLTKEISTYLKNNKVSFYYWQNLQIFIR